MNRSYSIEVVAPKPSNAIRAHEHPILESGNLSFPKARYQLELIPGEDQSSFVITHRIEKATLITRLLELSKARYVCIVSSPRSGYRCTHVSNVPKHEIRWNINELGEPPLLTPAVVCWEPNQHLTLSTDQDDVHPIWDKQNINLKKGSRLALGNIIQLQSSFLHLLSIEPLDSLKEGQFRVEIESEPFRFRAKVNGKLYHYLSSHQGSETRSNIMTHIVSACLSRLQLDYREDKDDEDFGWKTHRNLKAFSDFLKENGHKDWEDQDFRPEEVATALYPLKFYEQHHSNTDEGDSM